MVDPAPLPIWYTPAELLDEPPAPQRRGAGAPWFHNFGSSDALLAVADADVEEYAAYDEYGGAGAAFSRSFSALLALMRRSCDDDEVDAAPSPSGSLWYNNFGSNRALLDVMHASLDLHRSPMSSDTLHTLRSAKIQAAAAGAGTHRGLLARARGRLRKMFAWRTRTRKRPQSSRSLLSACVCGAHGD